MTQPTKEALREMLARFPDDSFLVNESTFESALVGDATRREWLLFEWWTAEQRIAELEAEKQRAFSDAQFKADHSLGLARKWLHDAGLPGDMQIEAGVRMLVDERDALKAQLAARPEPDQDVQDAILRRLGAVEAGHLALSNRLAQFDPGANPMLDELARIVAERDALRAKLAALANALDEAKTKAMEDVR